MPTALSDLDVYQPPNNLTVQVNQPFLVTGQASIQGVLVRVTKLNPDLLVASGVSLLGLALSVITLPLFKAEPAMVA